MRTYATQCINIAQVAGSTLHPLCKLGSSNELDAERAGYKEAQTETWIYSQERYIPEKNSREREIQEGRLNRNQVSSRNNISRSKSDTEDEMTQLSEFFFIKKKRLQQSP